MGGAGLNGDPHVQQDGNSAIPSTIVRIPWERIPGGGSAPTSSEHHPHEMLDPPSRGEHRRSVAYATAPAQRRGNPRPPTLPAADTSAATSAVPADRDANMEASAHEAMQDSSAQPSGHPLWSQSHGRATNTSNRANSAHPAGVLDGSRAIAVDVPAQRFEESLGSETDGGDESADEEEDEYLNLLSSIMDEAQAAGGGIREGVLLPSGFLAGTFGKCAH